MLGGVDKQYGIGGGGPLVPNTLDGFNPATEQFAEGSVVVLIRAAV